MKEKAISFLDKLIEISFYSLLFFIPISKAGLEVSFVTAFVAFLVKKCVSPQLRFFKSRNIFLLLFFIFSCLSLFNSKGYFIKSLVALTNKWAEYIILFIMAEDTFGNQPEKIKKAIKIFLAASFLVGIDAIFQRLFGFDFLRNRQLIIMYNGQYAVTASLQHYNDFGGYIIIPLSMIIAFLATGKPPWQKKLPSLILTAILGISLLLTFSRGAWIGFAFALILMLILSRKVKMIITVALIFVIALFLIPELQDRVLATFGQSGDAARFGIWKVVLQMISDNPFLGKGVGTFMDIFHKYAPSAGILYAHNSYLQIWAETGVLSLLSLLAFLAMLLAVAAKKIKEGKDPWLMGFFCGIAGFLMHNMLDSFLYSVQLSFLFWISLGLLSALISSSGFQTNKEK